MHTLRATSLELNGPVLGAPELRTYTPPPAAAERLLCYLFPKSKRDTILGDLEEDYRTDLLPKFGPRTARRMYWSQFVRSVAATLPAGVWAAMLGALAWLWSKLGN